MQRCDGDRYFGGLTQVCMSQTLTVIRCRSSETRSGNQQQRRSVVDPTDAAVYRTVEPCVTAPPRGARAIASRPKRARRARLTGKRGQKLLLIRIFVLRPLHSRFRGMRLSRRCSSDKGTEIRTFAIRIISPQDAFYGGYPALSLKTQPFRRCLPNDHRLVPSAWQ